MVDIAIDCAGLVVKVLDWLSTNKEAALKLQELSMHMKVVENLLNTIKSTPKNPKFTAVLDPALANAFQCIKNIFKHLDKAGKATKGYFPFFVSPDSAIKQVQNDSAVLERVVRILKTALRACALAGDLMDGKDDAGAGADSVAGGLLESNDEAKEFWKQNFGNRVIVDLAEMIAVLKKTAAMGPIDDEADHVVRIQLDEDKTNKVTAYAFATFIGQNPLKNAIALAADAEAPSAGGGPPGGKKLPAGDHKGAGMAPSGPKPSPSPASPSSPSSPPPVASKPVVASSTVPPPSAAGAAPAVAVESVIFMCDADHKHGEATYYCADCKKRFCSKCESSKHADAVPSAHKRSPLVPAVLWVDPNPQNNAGILEKCKAAGLKVICVNTAQDAITFFEVEDNKKLLRSEKFRCISNNQIYSMEEQCSKLSAAEDLIRFLRRKRSNVPVFIYCYRTLPLAQKFVSDCKYKKCLATSDEKAACAFALGEAIAW